MNLFYYISTETLGRKKINVMTDCLTLTIFSDRYMGIWKNRYSLVGRNNGRNFFMESN